MSRASLDRPPFTRSLSVPGNAALNEPMKRDAFASNLSIWVVVLYSALGGLLLWAALPPLDWSPLGWIATIPWIMLIMRSDVLTRRHYLAIWAASSLHWLAVLQGLRLAHPALYGGWILLSLYLAVYVPLFIGLSREWIHARGRSPLLVVPIVWTGLEFARAHLFTGLAAASLSHTQVAYPIVCQIADLAGAYTLSFVMSAVAAAITILFIPQYGMRTKLTAACTALALIGGDLAYGWMRLAYEPPGGPTARVLVVQGCVDTVLDGDPSRPRAMVEHYRDLTFSRLHDFSPCDLVLWPESSFAFTVLEADKDAVAPPDSGMTNEEFHRYLDDDYRRFDAVAVNFTQGLNEREPGRTSVLVGATTHRIKAVGGETYNSALLLSPEGTLAAKYHKQHLVLCGEYLPLGDWMPWIYTISPIGRGLQSGKEPVAFPTAGLRFSPSICFESTVPHLIRRQVNTLAAQGNEPDVLINITNDGWFYGSSILDIHIQCAIMRAIENRKPMVIAANTGISGVIDGSGRVLHRAPTHASEVFATEVQADGRRSVYRLVGDWPVGICLLFSLGGVASYFLRRRST